MALTILLVNGPNLNMLGKREPALYGTDTLPEIEARVKQRASGLGMQVECFQHNDEGALVTRIQQSFQQVDGIIINAGAYSHTSVALLDALSMHPCPIIEVHLSNIYRREPFRHHSYVSRVATGVICGLGAQGYLFALEAIYAKINPN